MSNQNDILNALLSGELSAVETYDMVLGKAKTPEVIKVLNECKAEHEGHVQKLGALIASAGGTPTTKSGIWGVIAKVVEAGAVLLGETAALGTLKEGEDHGVELYTSESKHLEGEALALVQNELLPSQLRTQKAIDSLSDRY